MAELRPDVPYIRDIQRRVKAGGSLDWEQVKALSEYVTELEQGIWDAYGILGFDTDGDPTPAALVHPLLSDLIRQAATEERAERRASEDELEEVEAVIPAMTTWSDLKPGDIILCPKDAAREKVIFNRAAAGGRRFVRTDRHDHPSKVPAGKLMRAPDGR